MFHRARKNHEKQTLFALAQNAQVIIPLTRREKMKMVMPHPVSLEETINLWGMGYWMVKYVGLAIATMIILSTSLLSILSLTLVSIWLILFLVNSVRSAISPIANMCQNAYVLDENGRSLRYDLIIQGLYEIQDPLERIQVAQAIIPLHKHRSALQKQCQEMKDLLDGWREKEVTAEIQNLAERYTKAIQEIENYTQLMYQALPPASRLRHLIKVQDKIDEIDQNEILQESENILYSKALSEVLADEHSWDKRTQQI